MVKDLMIKPLQYIKLKFFYQKPGILTQKLNNFLKGNFLEHLSTYTIVNTTETSETFFFTFQLPM